MIKWPHVLLIVLLLTGCKKAFNPPGALSDTNKYLVIDGVINTGNDSTYIRLSRTKKFDTVIVIDKEMGAQVRVESDANNTYPLSEINPGTYSAAPLNLDNSHKYRLRIKTSDGKEYVSDFVQVKNAPPIDSVGFVAKPSMVQIYVNTHDPTNNTKYYRWEYSEAWRFHATYQSFWIGAARRDSSEFIYYCYSKDTSSYITLSTSAQLAQDVIYQAPITTIPSSSEKIQIRYSIFVKQYALTSGAYSFWSNLHKNGESNGTIFDAQPSDNQTNYHCVTNPNEIVIGYLSAGSTTTKRVFINRDQFPASYDPRYSLACAIDTAWGDKGEYTVFNSPYVTAIEGVFTYPPLPFGAPNAVTYSSSDCADCTTRGVTKPPPFWK
jgi:hypothetical protein